jgi:hypothetical protein
MLPSKQADLRPFHRNDQIGPLSIGVGELVCPMTREVGRHAEYLSHRTSSSLRHQLALEDMCAGTAHLELPTVIRDGEQVRGRD